jgi:hypothetical protein
MHSRIQRGRINALIADLHQVTGTTLCVTDSHRLRDSHDATLICICICGPTITITYSGRSKTPGLSMLGWHEERGAMLIDEDQGMI